MATAYQPIQSVTRTAPLDLAATTGLVAVAAGDTFPAGGDIWLRVKTSGTATTVTVTNSAVNQGGFAEVPATLFGGALPATGDRMCGPFPSAYYADQSDGQVHLAFTATTGVTAGVYRFDNA